MKTSRFLLTGLSALALSLSTSVVFAAPSCCVTRGGETLGFAATEPGPFLSFGAQEKAFTRQLDLFGADKVTLHNPSAESAAKVQVRMVDQKGRAQTIAVELAAGDVASFDVPADAVHLFATSRQQVEIEVGNSGGFVGLESPADDVGMTRTCQVDGDCGGGGGTVISYCTGNWTLTCLSGGCQNLGPFTAAGQLKVDEDLNHLVSWNLNTPTGNYTTQNPQELTATWYAPGTSGSSQCPTSVTNSLGHTYTIARSSSLAGNESASKAARFKAPANDVGNQSLTEEICEGPWTLYCNTVKSPGCSGLGPFTHDGTVIVVGATKNVFWSQNTPTGSYTTEAPGGLTATWYPAGTSGDLRCPVEVQNSLGHWYTVVR